MYIKEFILPGDLILLLVIFLCKVASVCMYTELMLAEML